MSNLGVVILPAAGSFCPSTFEAAHNSLRIFRRTGKANYEFFENAVFLLKLLENSKTILEHAGRVPDDLSFNTLELKFQHEAVMQCMHEEFPEEGEQEIKDMLGSLISFLDPICETGKLNPSGEDLFDELLILVGRLAVFSLKVTVH